MEYFGYIYIWRAAVLLVKIYSATTYTTYILAAGTCSKVPDITWIVEGRPPANERREQRYNKAALRASSLPVFVEPADCCVVVPAVSP